MDSSAALKPQKGKFAMIGHPPDLGIFRNYIQYLKPDKTFKDELIIKLFEWTPAYKVKEWQNYSLDGTSLLDGLVIMVPFLPEMTEIKLAQVKKKIDQALGMAAESGCSVASLGGFASIVLQSQEKDYEEKHGIKITSGNTITTALIVKSLEDICSRLGVDLSKEPVAIVGASGDIGSGCMAYLGSRVGKLVLTARGIPKLQEAVSRYQSGIKCEIEICDDYSQTLEKARIFIFATSAFKPFARISEFKAGSIICDASMPRNVDFSTDLRPDVFLYHGGMAKIPEGLDPGFDIGLDSPTTFFGCQLEGIMMARNPGLPHSWGRGNINMEKINIYMEEIKSLNQVAVTYTTGKRKYSDYSLLGYKNLWHVMGYNKSRFTA